ncbi:YitT family protein [Enterococcus hulanensis]|uniref:YczE/YyaS/YitT family protein n=1 Tax=Enterococcus hulanensis TaxID=2559929 RepID=UPI001A8F7CB8|nr:YitT family protein [Enterococcus hulanensis]MBO0457718.1 YitT family protein [Enterococcus hulanensis]
MRNKLLVNILGSSLMGIGISLLIWLELGVDTISILYLGIQQYFALPIWLLCFLFNIIVVLLVFVIERNEIGLGTVINFLILTICLKYFPLLLANFSIDNVTQTVQGLLLLAGVCILAVGCGLYASANLGSAALEALSAVVSKKITISFKIVRIFFDGLLVIAGLLLGAKIGVGTILCVLLIGPISQQVQKNVLLLK